MARFESDGQINDPLCIRQSEYDKLKAEVETLKNDAAAAVSQIHGHRDNIRKLELQISELRSALLDSAKLFALFALRALTMEDVKSIMPRIEALTAGGTEKREGAIEYDDRPRPCNDRNELI